MKYSLPLLIFLFSLACKKEPLVPEEVFGTYYAEEGEFMGNIIVLDKSYFATICFSNNLSATTEYILNVEKRKVTFGNGRSACFNKTNGSFYFDEVVNNEDYFFVDSDEDGINDTGQLPTKTIRHMYKK